MSDNRNPNPDYRDPNDPLRRDARVDPDAGARNAAWGWIAAAVFLVVVLAVAFGVGHQPGQSGTNTASNDVTPPPAMNRMAPPAVAPTPAPPITPAPNTPAQGSSQ